jgi:hypothetical protein
VDAISIRVFEALSLSPFKPVRPAFQVFRAGNVTQATGVNMEQSGDLESLDVNPG